MSLDDLPDISFCETDPAAVEAETMGAFERVSGRTLYPGNPERLFLEAEALLLAQQRFLIDWTGKQNLLAYATGDYLNHLGEFYACPRLAATRATTALRFFTDAPKGFAILIPAGTRASPDGKLYFATTATAVIEAGATHADAGAACAEAGPAGSGFVAGQINRLTDPLAGVTAVANLTTSFGGADEEDDDRYRRRVRLAPEAFSVCGPEGAYVYHALTASPTISDVAAVAHEPGVVTVYPWCAPGLPPPGEIVAAVNAALTDRKVRPLTDVVQVRPPEIVAYDVRATWWLAESASGKAASVQAAVSAALADYLAWQRARLGRDIDPSELTARIKAAGVKRVEVAEPRFLRLDPWQAAIPDSVALHFGGMEGA